MEFFPQPSKAFGSTPLSLPRPAPLRPAPPSRETARRVAARTGRSGRGQADRSGRGEGFGCDGPADPGGGPGQTGLLAPMQPSRNIRPRNSAGQHAKASDEATPIRSQMSIWIDPV